MLSWGEYLAYGVKDAVFRDGDIELERRFDPRMYPSGNYFYRALSIHRNL